MSRGDGTLRNCKQKRLAFEITLFSFLSSLTFIFPNYTTALPAQGFGGGNSSSSFMSSEKVGSDYLKSRFSGSWLVDMDFKTMAEAEDSAAQTRLNVGLKGNYQVTPDIDVYAYAKARMSSGRVQSRYKEAGGESSISPYDFYLRYKFGASSEVRAGSNSQSFLNNPLLVSSFQSFPGAIVRLSHQELNYGVALVGQKAILTSSSLEGDRNDREALPTFETLTLEANFKSKFFEPKLAVTRFNYNELPAVVAFRSEAMGNSTLGANPSDKNFVFGFAGFQYYADGCFCFNDSYKINLTGAVIENELAPTTYNRSVSFSGTLSVKSKWGTFKPQYGRFYIESDAVPAYYNSAFLGHNNRQGEQVSVDMEFERLHFKLKSKWVRSEAIQPHKDQETLTSFYIGVETLDVAF